MDKNYDSEFCGSIPLHLVNLIQPHGVLLVVDKAELRVVQASVNVESFLGISVEDLLEQSLSSYLPTEQFADIQSKIADQPSQAKIPVSLTFMVQGTPHLYGTGAPPGGIRAHRAGRKCVSCC